MNAKEILKPDIFKIFIFLFIGIIYLYFAKESVCAVSFYFAFCYNAYGFPFQYMVDGNIESAYSQIKASFLGEYFNKSGNILFNPAAFALDLALIYLLACFIYLPFKHIKS